jgi:hypothetical protein
MVYKINNHSNSQGTDKNLAAFSLIFSTKTSQGSSTPSTSEKWLPCFSLHF